MVKHKILIYNVYIRILIFSFEFIHNTFSNLTPCVLILNNGSDPTKHLVSLAEKNDITGPTYKILSLGICEENVCIIILKNNYFFFKYK